MSALVSKSPSKSDTAGAARAAAAEGKSGESIDFEFEAQARGMQLLSCAWDDMGGVELNLDLGKGRVFTLSGVPGRGPFRVSTTHPFLLDGLFVENLEEIQSQARRIQEVMSAAAEVHMCISGDGDEGEEDGGEGEKYDYDYGGEMELIMDDEQAKRSSPGAQEGGSVYEDTNISKMLGEKALVGGVGKGSASSSANTRLMRDLSRLMRSDTEKLGFSLQLKNDDALHEWNINLFGFSDCPLAEDMKKLEKEKRLDHVRLVMKFNDDYPFSPPFVRIVYPRFKRSTGYIIDGAFCMELLTNQARILFYQGWTPTNDIESVVVQIRAQMVVGKARIDFGNRAVTQPYSEDRAKAAFRSAAKIHKWAISDP
ncbi:unnamed protein product [Ascophyllum nodosum]